MAAAFCLRCFRSIDKRDSTAASLWGQICCVVDLRDNLIKIKLNNGISDEMKTLEELGFILTHETDENIVIRVNGHDSGCGYSTYCMNRCEHFSHEEM